MPTALSVKTVPVNAVPANAMSAASDPAHISTPAVSPWRLCVAPMMDWTDRHCRYFHRLLAPRARLYTEMVTTGALIHGDVAEHLRFNVQEHPLALQLGGSEWRELALCARMAEAWGYDEVNLNCGCPSERVQRGAFGACLMAEPQLVADCVKAMRDAVTMPVTVKHRLGLDDEQRYSFVRDFVGTVAEAGCQVFVVHARNAWLKGLSPKENRERPPLRYESVQQLKSDFPELIFVLNGGLSDTQEMVELLQAQPPALDGVMVGRAAYHQPWLLRTWQAALFDGGVDTVANARASHSPAITDATVTRQQIEQQMVAYMAEQAKIHKTPWANIARHMLGLYHGETGARRWRQVWSDHHLKPLAPEQVYALAHQRSPEPLVEALVEPLLEQQ